MLGANDICGLPRPVPVIATTCGESGALLVKVKKAVLEPTPEGDKETEAVQFDPTANTPPHVVVSLKSPAFGPDNETPKIERAVLPLLVRFIVCAPLVQPIACPVNVKLIELRLARAARTPIPLRLTLCGALATESLNTNVAERVPSAVGVNVTVTVQLAPTPSAAPHVVAALKSVAFAPVTQILLMPRIAFPEFVTITGDNTLDTPIFWLPNVRFAALNATLGTGPNAPFPINVATGAGEDRFKAFVVIDTFPLNEKVVVGTNATLIVQLDPAATLDAEEQST